MRRVHRPQRLWHSVKGDVGADAAFESTHVQEVAHATDGEREHGVFHVGSRPFEDRVGLKECRLDLDGFETAVESVEVRTMRSLNNTALREP